MKKSKNSNLQFRPHPKKGLLVKRAGEWHSVAPYIKIPALAHEEGGDHFLLVIEFEVDGAQLRYLHPARDTLNPKAIIAELVSRGYAISQSVDDHALVEAYLSTTRPDHRVTILRRTGWYGDVYVRPDGGIIPECRDQSLVYEPEDRATLKPANGGTLEGWQRSVAVPATHSSVMMFAISAGFAALIMNYTPVESGMFHIFGKTTAGKSLTLCVGLSVGECGTKVGMPHWDFTNAGFEELAAAHSDRLLAIDEAGHIQTDTAVEKLRRTAFAMTTGSGRIRSRHFKGSTNITNWKLLALSSGEQPVSDLVRSAGKRRIGGEQVRLIDVPATKQGRFGVFDSLPDGIEPAEFAGAIEKSAARHYGHAAEVFLRRLTKKDRESRQNEITKYRREFRSRANVAGEGFERRFSSKFELCYAAGRFAVKWGILPWSNDQLFTAIEETYLSARRSAPEYESMIHGALSKVIRHLQTSRRGIEIKALKKMDNTERVAAVDGAAFLTFIGPGRELIYGVKKETLIRWMGDGISLQVFEQFLLAQGVLLVTKRSLAMKQVSVPGSSAARPYLYCFRSSRIDALNLEAGGQDRDRTAE